MAIPEERVALPESRDDYVSPGRLTSTFRIYPGRIMGSSSVGRVSGRVTLQVTVAILCAREVKHLGVSAIDKSTAVVAGVSAGANRVVLNVGAVEDACTEVLATLLLLWRRQSIALVRARGMRGPCVARDNAAETASNQTKCGNDDPQMFSCHKCSPDLYVDIHVIFLA